METQYVKNLNNWNSVTEERLYCFYITNNYGNLYFNINIKKKLLKSLIS